MFVVPPNSKIIIQRFYIQQLKDEFIAGNLHAYVSYTTWFILLCCTNCDIVRDILKSFYNFITLQWNIKKVHDKHACYILYLKVTVMYLSSSPQNPTLETASAPYKPSKMSTPSTCHSRLKQVAEAGCCFWLQEWKTTCSLSSRMEELR